MLFYGSFGAEARISLALALPQDQSAGGSEGYGCGRIGVCGRLRGPSGSPPPGYRMGCRWAEDLGPENSWDV